MVYTIILLPALLAVIPVRTLKTQKDKSGDGVIERLLERVGLIATGHPYKILVISSVIMVLSIVGAMKIHFSHDVLKWLPKETPLALQRRQ